MRHYVYNVTIGKEYHQVVTDGKRNPFEEAYSKLSSRARALGLSDPEEVDQDESSHIYAVDRYDDDSNLVEEVEGRIELDHYFEV